MDLRDELVSLKSAYDEIITATGFACQQICLHDNCIKNLSSDDCVTRLEALRKAMTLAAMDLHLSG